MGTCCSRRSPDPTHHLGINYILFLYFNFKWVNPFCSFCYYTLYSTPSWLQNTRYFRCLK